MMKLIKISLISALMATGAMASDKVLPANALTYEGMNLTGNIKLAGNLFNGGVITKDISATIDTPEISGQSGSAVIYNIYQAQLDEDALDGKLPNSEQTLRERIVELAGDCLNCSSTGCAGTAESGPYNPQDVYTIMDRGTIDSSVKLATTGNTVTERNEGLWASFNDIKVVDATATSVFAEHRVFNLVSTQENQIYYADTISTDLTATTTIVSIPTVSGQYPVNLELQTWQPLDLLRSFNQTLILNKAKLYDKNGKAITIQGKIVAKDNGGDNVIKITGKNNVNDSGTSTTPQITFAEEVDLSKATAVTFEECQTVFKKKLTI